MKQDKIERLITVMKANKIKYDRKFESILDCGFSSEAQEAFFEETISNLEDLLHQGVNGDFNKSMRDTVTKLSTVAVKSGDTHRGSSVNMEKLRSEKEKILMALKAPKEATMEFDLRQNAKRYIQSTRDGMMVLNQSSLAQSEQEKSYIRDCEQLLDKAEDAVNNAIDVTSPEAAKKYNALIFSLNKWRNSLAKSGGFYSQASVTQLRDVTNAAQDWSRLIVAGKKIAKKGEYYEEIPQDKLTQVIDSEALHQNVKAFFARCDAFHAELERISNDPVQIQIDNFETQKEECEKQENEIVVQFKNGEISRDKANAKLRKLKEAKEDLDFKIHRLGSNRISRKNIIHRRNMIEKIEEPIRSCYSMVSDNRLHIYTIFNGMDFSRLISIINSTCSTAEFNEGIEAMQRSLLSKGYINEQGKVQMKAIEDSLAQVNSMLNFTPESEEEEDLIGAKLGNGDKDENEDLLGALLEKDEQSQERTRVGNSDNDIM